MNLIEIEIDNSGEKSLATISPKHVSAIYINHDDRTAISVDGNIFYSNAGYDDLVATIEAALTEDESNEKVRGC